MIHSRRALILPRWSLGSLSLSFCRSRIETLIFPHSNHHCVPLVPWLIDGDALLLNNGGFAFLNPTHAFHRRIIQSMDLVFTEGRRIHAGRVEPPDAKLIVIFLNLFGDVQSIKRVEDMHAKLFLPHRSMSELKKRHVEDFLSSDKVKTSRTYSAQSPAQSMIGAYPNAQNQWTNYGVQPETWPSVTQAQGQQWTAGYVR
ncbi:uncharacterized protein LOC106756765 isoform X3 [Vigna radiata var. radiata]|nr:uncharacterized protein LOC106756765 isoform X3 [Vigna radiata var. radiata]